MRSESNEPAAQERSGRWRAEKTEKEQYTACSFFCVKGEFSDKGVILAQQGLNLRDVRLREIGAVVHGDRGGEAGRLPGAAAGGHDAEGGLRLMAARNTPPGGDQVPDVLRHKAPVGDRVVRALFKVVMARAGALRVVDVDVVVAGRDGIVKAHAVLEVGNRQRVKAVDHAALAHADFRGGGEQHAVFKARTVFLQEGVELEHLAARFAFAKLRS